LNKSVRGLIGISIGLLTAYYFSTQLSGHWFELFRWTHRVDFLPLVFSIFLLILYHFIAAWFYKKWLHFFGEETEWSVSFKILYISQMARFLPGGIWGHVGRIYLGDKEGIPKKKMVLASIGHLALNVLTGVILASALIPFKAIRLSNSLIGPFLVVGVIILSLILPKGASILELWSYKKNGTNKISPIRFIQIFKLSMMYIGQWFLYGIAFWLLLMSFQIIEQISFKKTMGALAFSGSGVLMTPFIPGGIGVREGLLSFLLQPSLTSSDAAIVAIFSRIWLLLVDLICFGLAFSLKSDLMFFKKRWG